MQTLTMKLKLAALGLTAIIVVGAGLSLAPTSVPSQPVLAQDDKPPAAASGKVDRFGDPLPAGAVIRLGTLGFRESNLAAIGFRKTGELVGFGEDVALHIWPADGRPKVATTLLLGKKE